jgi:hypothetical protein
MANTSVLAVRFSELLQQLAAVEATKKHEASGYMSGDYVDNNQLINWKTKAKNLLSMACGKDSIRYTEFVEFEKTDSYTTNYETLNRLKAVFLAAKEDYEGGYLNSVRNLVKAEVFGSELDQAKELFSAGYRAAAAVVAGVVLETTIRQMCADRSIAYGKLDKMNADLAKSGAYNLLVQKKLTALADIRNNAAHGHPEQFKDSDVSEMIVYVEDFVAEQL